MLAVSAMDPTVQGIFFLIATIVFVLAGVLAYKAALWHALVAWGLAFATFVFMWNAFAAAG